MPCGGIHPKLGHWTENPCWVCEKTGCDLFCDEWDTPLHSECVEAFLQTEEGRCVLYHGHEVIVIRDGREHVLHPSRVWGET